MKCEHCGYEAPERAVICPECGEILPRPKKPAAEEQAKKEPSPAAEKFSMPFLSAPADLEKADGIAAEDPEELRRAAQEKKFRRTRRIVAAAVAFVLILLAVVYYVFFWSYKLAVFRYVKGVDYSSGSMYYQDGKRTRGRVYGLSGKHLFHHTAGSQVHDERLLRLLE